MDVAVFKAGGYRYIKGVFQYSGGVAAEAGFEIERARLRKPLPGRSPSLFGPRVVGLEFEMDVRRAAREIVIRL